MNTPILPESTLSHRGADQIVVLYDDLLAADSGFAFALNLHTEVGIDVGCPAAHCCLERLGIPDFARELDHRFVQASYVVLSLRGDTELSHSKKEWLEEWLSRQEVEQVAILVVVDATRSRPAPLGMIQAELEQLGDVPGVEVFFFRWDQSLGGHQLEAGDTSDVLEEDDPTIEWFVGAADGCPEPRAAGLSAA
jgi:hypothetical protein